MMLVIAHFQYRENYGYRWKFKGGETAEIASLSPDVAARMAQDETLTPFVEEQIALREELVWKNEETEQYLLGWELVDESELVFMDDDNEIQAAMFSDELDFIGSYIRIDKTEAWCFRRKE